eukprot:12884995-Prorocentrum_lima.AAC.1
MRQVRLFTYGTPTQQHHHIHLPTLNKFCRKLTQKIGCDNRCQQQHQRQNSMLVPVSSLQ